MKVLTVCVVALLAVSAHAQTTDVPLDVKAFAKKQVVIDSLSTKNISVEYTPADEYAPPFIQALAVSWKDLDYDTLRVYFDSEIDEAQVVVLIKSTEASGGMQTLADVSDAVALLYGEPNEKSDVFVQWTRKGAPAVSVMMDEEETLVEARFEFNGIYNRLSSTEANWPFDVAVDDVSDDIAKHLTKLCGRVTERDESNIGTVACNVFGVKSRRMYVRLDGFGMAHRIEATFDPDRLTELRPILEKKYGPPTATFPNLLSWRGVGVTDAVQVSVEAGEMTVIFNLLQIEKMQYRD